MKYLIDTHILIWFVEGNDRLDENIRSLIANPLHEIYISQASLWELTIKISIGKLSLSISVSELEIFLIDQGFKIIETKFIHYDKLQNLPFYHQDPFDRLIISQAQAEDYTIITRDDRFKQYDVKLL
ncbi:type II toxin-antitoxin system VapC family toxin [Microcoleus sp. ARI1-B5]|uniref:type II toxin-antitoxin system VapC family toxin n=1 Tax=unclassified Microcoleus TaxID=2642155 RepID=UPI002FD3E73C